VSGPFIFDDVVAIIENESLRAWWRLGHVLTPARELPTAGRPLVNLSFAINYALGGLHVAGYHLVNIVLHVLCGLLLFGLVKRTLALPALADRWAGRAPTVAFTSAALWTLHPLNTEAVNYLTERTELMMALCYLLTLYAGCRAWRAAHAWRWYAVALVACVAGMACKETMVTAPVAVVLYDRVFLFASWRDAWRARWRWYVGLASSWALLGALLWSGPRVHSAGFGTGVSPWTYALNQTVMLTRYLWLMVWPRSLVINYGTPESLTITDVLPYVLLIGILLAVTIVALIKAPRPGFLAAFACLTLAPTSSLIPIATEVGAERRMYLPLVALVTLVVCGVTVAMEYYLTRPAPNHWPRRNTRLTARLGALLGVVTAVTLASWTALRNREYRSSVELSRVTLARHPTSTAHFMLGAELSILGSTRKRSASFAPRCSARRAPATSSASICSSRADSTRRLTNSAPLFEINRCGLEAVSARQVLGQALAKRQRWPEAIAQLQQVLQMYPSPVQRLAATGLLADAWYRQRAYGDAIRWYRTYLARQPADVEALTNLAISLTATDQLPEALPLFRRAADLDPSNAACAINLANALADSGQYEEAIAAAQRAITLRPDQPAAYDVLGRSLAAQGNWVDAANTFGRALQLAPRDPEALEALNKLQAAGADRRAP
jgi:protein O-mannosyl-transferase